VGSFVFYIFLTVISFILAFPGLSIGPLFGLVLADSANQTDVLSKKSSFSSQTMPLLLAARSGSNNGRGNGGLTVQDGKLLVPDTAPVPPTETDAPLGEGRQISVYVVRPGDNISQIAEMFNVSANTIMWANDLNKGKSIQPGDTLVILPVTGVKYVVKKGDTLVSIAKTYGAEAIDIAEFNNIEGSLVAGTEIIVPNGKMVPPKSIVTSSKPKTQSTTPAYNGYYARPISGGVRTQGIHGYNAVDLAAKVGTPIMAAADGTVTVAKMGGWNSGYGNYVVISHANGTQTLYAHAESVIVKVGQVVNRGETVAYIGLTGRTTGAHVHFEIRGAKNPF
jgi:LysM repeat protein